MITPDASGIIRITSRSYYTVTPDNYGNMTNRTPVQNYQTTITIDTRGRTVTIKRNDRNFLYNILRINGDVNPSFRCTDSNSATGCYININTVSEYAGDVWISYDNNKDIHYLFNF